MADFTIQTKLIPGKRTKDAQEIIRQEIRSALEDQREVAVETVRSKMRMGVTGNEQASVVSEIVETQTSLGLLVESSDVAAAIDEGGLPAHRNFPPFGVGSDLYEWVVERIGLAPQGPRQYSRPTDFRSIAFLVARRQFERGLPAPGDELRRPFATTMQEMTPQVRDAMKQARARAVRRINSGIA